MRRSRKMVSCISRGVISDIVKNMSLRECVVVENAGHEKTNYSQITNEDTVCLVVDKMHKKFPKEYKDALTNNMDMTVVEIIDNGKAVAVYLSNVAESELREILGVKGVQV